MPREVTFQFPDGPQPVRGRLFRYQLDVQERGSGHVRVAGTDGTASRGRRPSHAVATQSDDTRGHVGHQVLVQPERFGDGERPTGLERAADHRGAGRGRCRGQSERVQEAQTAHAHGQVHVVDGRAESRQQRPRDRRRTVRTVTVQLLRMSRNRSVSTYVTYCYNDILSRDVVGVSKEHGKFNRTLLNRTNNGRIRSINGIGVLRFHSHCS